MRSSHHPIHHPILPSHTLIPSYPFSPPPLQWCPSSYAHSTISVFGKIQNHEEESDRTDGKRLEVGFRATCWLWDRLFGKSFIRAGVLYRGEIPTLVPGSPPMLPPVDDVAVGGEERRDVNLLLGLRQRSICQVRFFDISIFGNRN